jgi:hypothetical protein
MMGLEECGKGTELLPKNEVERGQQGDKRESEDIIRMEYMEVGF